MKRKKKKLISIILSLTMSCGFIMLPNVSYAKDKVAETNTKIFLNNHQLQTTAYTMNGRTLVPLRKITEALGSSVEWDGDTKMITVQRGLQTAIFKIGDNNVYSREKEILDTHSVLYEDTTLIPLRAISEIFGAVVTWDGDSNSVYIDCNIPTADETIDDFVGFGFRRFNYYGETFMNNHADGSGFNSAVWGTSLGSLDKWAGRGLKAMVNFFSGKGFDTEYEKDMYKKVISQVLSELNGDYTADKFPESFENVIKGTKEVYSFSVDEACKALEKAGKQNGLSSADIKNRKEDLDIFSDALSKVGKTIKWSQFTVDEIAFIMADYTENVHMLTVLENVLSDDKNNKDLKSAVSELKMEYATKYIKTIVDLKDEIIGYGAGKIIGSASSLYSIVSFCIETGVSIIGWKDYSDNVMDAATLTTVVSALNWELDEMSEKIFDIHTKTIKKNVTEKQWSDYVELFKLTQAAVKEQYNCMYSVTTIEMEKRYLDDQMKVIDSLKISRDIPTDYYESFSIGETNRLSAVPSKTGMRYEQAFQSDNEDNTLLLYKFEKTSTGSYKEQPYILYNGNGKDLRVEWIDEYYNKDKGLINIFVGNPKIHIIYGDDAHEILSPDKITNGQEIDLSNYGIGKDVKILDWALVFDKVEMLSKAEYKSRYGKEFENPTSIGNTIAYNYLVNDNKKTEASNNGYSNIATYGNYTAVQQNGKIGIIDKNGKIIVPFEYDNELDTFIHAWNYNFKDGYFILSKNKKYGVIDKNGKVIVPFEYYHVYGSNPSYLFEADKVMGVSSGIQSKNVDYFNKNGNLITDRDTINKYFGEEAVLRDVQDWLNDNKATTTPKPSSNEDHWYPTCPSCGKTDMFVDPSTGLYMCRLCDYVEPYYEGIGKCEKCGSYDQHTIEKSGYLYVKCYSCEDIKKYNKPSEKDTSSQQSGPHCPNCGSGKFTATFSPTSSGQFICSDCGTTY